MGHKEARLLLRRVEHEPGRLLSQQVLRQAHGRGRVGAAVVRRALRAQPLLQNAAAQVRQGGHASRQAPALAPEHAKLSFCNPCKSHPEDHISGMFGQAGRYNYLQFLELRWAACGSQQQHMPEQEPSEADSSRGVWLPVPVSVEQGGVYDGLEVQAQRPQVVVQRVPDQHRARLRQQLRHSQPRVPPPRRYALRTSPYTSVPGTGLGAQVQGSTRRTLGPYI